MIIMHSYHLNAYSTLIKVSHMPGVLKLYQGLVHRLKAVIGVIETKGHLAVMVLPDRRRKDRHLAGQRLRVLNVDVQLARLPALKHVDQRYNEATPVNLRL